MWSTITESASTGSSQIDLPAHGWKARNAALSIVQSIFPSQHLLQMKPERSAMKLFRVFLAVAFLSCAGSAAWGDPGVPNGGVPLSNQPSSSPNAGIIPGVTGSAASSLVLKASPGNLYAAYANSTISGYLMVFNAVSAPANGPTTAGTASGNMVECIGPGTSLSLDFGPGPPEVYSVGITVVFSSTPCSTLTASATAFIRGGAQ